MSSNIKLNRVCVYCHKNFVARTTVTKFCSLDCNRRHYKAKKREFNIENSDVETLKKVNDHRVVNQTKNLLSIIEAANLLGCSRATIYKMIKMRRLNAVNFLGKLTRVRREDILAKFDANFQELSIAEPLKTTKTSTNITEDQSIKNYYSIDELVIIFNKSRTALYTAFARAGVPKIKVGKQVYFDKNGSEKLLKKSQLPKQNSLEKERIKNQKLAEQGLKPSQCYSIDECVKMFGKDRSLLYGIFNRRLIPKIRDGHNVLLSKKAIDSLLKTFKKEGMI